MLSHEHAPRVLVTPLWSQSFTSKAYGCQECCHTSLPALREMLAEMAGCSGCYSDGNAAHGIP